MAKPQSKSSPLNELCSALPRLEQTEARLAAMSQYFAEKG
jgi:hypothetical protein